MMQDKYGDHIKVYTTESKRDIFVDCFYEDTPQKLQFRAVLGRKEALELIDKLKSALVEIE